MSATASGEPAAIVGATPDADAPTVLRMVLGNQLRQLREDLGITQQQAGDAIRASAPKISRLESGRTPLKPRDAADLLTRYGVHDDTRRSISCPSAGSWPRAMTARA